MANIEMEEGDETGATTEVVGQLDSVVMPDDEETYVTVPSSVIRYVCGELLYQILQPEVEYHEDQLTMANRVIEENKVIAALANAKLSEYA